MKAKKVISMVLVSVAAMSLLAGCSRGAGSSQEETQSETEAAATESETEAATTESETEAAASESEEAETAQSEDSEETMQSEDEEATAETGSGELEETPQSETGTEAVQTGDTQEASADDTASQGNVLVVYYSATGNTEAVANTIAEATGGDLFELEPAEPYTDADLDWTDEESRVSQEYADESLRNVELVASTVDNWDSYDTVFIGYPIWWGIAAWPVDSFVENNDFTGKTVIPFATSSSSGMGESGQLLADLAGTGDWQEGQRFRSGADEANVQEWVNGLGL